MLDLDYSENIYDEPFDDPLYEGDEDQLALGAAAGSWLGGLGGGELSGYLYDTAAGALAGSDNKRARDFGREMKKSRWGRTLVTNTGSTIGGAAGGALGAAIPWFEAEAGEEAYEARDVDEMAALLEVALESDGEGAEDALSSLVNKAFGVLRGTNRLHDAMRAVHAKVRQIVAQARRNPHMQAAARAVPIALRKTASAILKRIAAEQPVNGEIALRIFAGVIAQILDNPPSRRAAVTHNRARARRHFSRR